MTDHDRVLLGTVLLEPNRWGQIDPQRRSTIDVVEYLDRITEAGFDGIEIWEDHFIDTDESARSMLCPHVGIYNSYTSLDEPEQNGRDGVAALVGQTAATGIKFNVGNDPLAELDYAERIASWLDRLDEHQRLLCECHAGISLAEDPATAARIFAAAGPASRLQAIAHTHDEPELLREKFEAYGERITHVHVNYLPEPPTLRDNIERIESTVTLLTSLGFTGSYTIEFTHGVLDPSATPAALLNNAIDDLVVLREILR